MKKYCLSRKMQHFYVLKEKKNTYILFLNGKYHHSLGDIQYISYPCVEEGDCRIFLGQVLAYGEADKLAFSLMSPGNLLVSRINESLQGKQKPPLGQESTFWLVEFRLLDVDY